MSRLLLLIVIFVAIYLLFRSYSKQLHKGQPEQKASATAEDMVCCGHCGVHLPKHESVMHDERHFCSEAHRRAYIEQHK